MRGKKCVGLDVNGWRDHFARNWTVIPGEEERVGGIHVGSAGPLTSVVRIGDEDTDHWIGGFPADLAPHGRGGGWGEIGAQSRRLFVRDLIEGRAGEPRHLASAFTDLARGAGHTVLAIDDSPETTETVQERLLDGMAAARMRNPTLVWRTVLAVLYAIDDGLIRKECSVGIVSHASSGLSVQKFRVRQAGTLRNVLAPERRRLASVIMEPFGLRKLVSECRHRAIGTSGYNARTAALAMARSVGRMAFGMPFEREILRLEGGDWEEVALEPGQTLPPAKPEVQLLDLADCDQVFLETITEGEIRSQLEIMVGALGIEDIRTFPADAVARGALVAAERMAAGDPIYFDFLPRISTIVLGQNTAQNFDLIKESETLEAGRIYRSPQPAALAIPKGIDEISIYLRKDGTPHPRKAVVALGSSVQHETPVSVWVEQKPAAGRARIVMEAPALARSFAVDWEHAEEDERDWTNIIDDLASPLPAVPDRLVLECGAHAWEDSSSSAGMSRLLDDACKGKKIDWELLANKATSSPYQTYWISSDGKLPSGIEIEDRNNLDTVTSVAVHHNQARLEAWNSNAKNNEALRFLTWQFRRCPSEVCEWLASCIEEHAGRIGTHPFVWHQSNWVLIYQGFARTVRDSQMEDRVLHSVLRRGTASWNYRAESACVALLLSRSDSAPQLLNRKDVEDIGKRAIFEFNEEFRSQYTKFNYAPFLVGGLMRWRMKEPRALVIGNDPLADQLEKVIVRARKDFSGRQRASLAFQKKRERYVPILDGLLEYLRGKGGNPNLLRDIYDA